ncbi:IucA/IucC family C-terminal-domain containing protein [Paenibacillus sp. NPDC058071]|uniref:IucA/IucC family C-terminal-domain containing protein n=1 Tax=Paenibacillus sp. NPDC058071 TaxID=3346326 RepID=UPI0036D7F1E4
MQEASTGCVLEPIELEMLKTYCRLTTEPSPDRTYSLAAADLLDGEKCREYGNKIILNFATANRTVSFSLFAKRYAFMMVATGLSAMSLFNKAMDYSIANCHIESFRNEQTWLLKLRLNERKASRPVSGKRGEWRDEVIRSLFAGNIAMAWRSIAETEPISKAVLWENAAIYVYWLYEKNMAAEQDEQRRERMHEDFQYLLHDAPGSLFGEKANPLAKYNSPKIVVPKLEAPIRVRKTCCYYYMTSDETDDYCNTCPKAQRQRVRQGE